MSLFFKCKKFPLAYTQAARPACWQILPTWSGWRRPTPTGGTRQAYYLPAADTEVTGHNMTISYEISDSLSVKSITGYRELDYNGSTNFSQSFGSAGNLKINTVTQHEQLSQKFQFLGTYESVNFVAGLYYLKQEGTQT